ncbi:MAG: hypothetical protein JWQ28_2091 [Pedobacter sp.]|jgi:hypothetical protein|nr:hypothetical protein [Pedobacter sp.]
MRGFLLRLIFNVFNFVGYTFSNLCSGNRSPYLIFLKLV